MFTAGTMFQNVQIAIKQTQNKINKSQTKSSTNAMKRAMKKELFVVKTGE
jgi:predicted metallo-beta-lactamase superfamily hydrolase